jgi:hypothetical protein
VATVLVGARTAAAQSQWLQPVTPAPKHEAQAPAVEKNLKVFDVADFDVFSGQKWGRLRESHTDDVVVTWPDGHETHGLAKHIEDMKSLFAYAPDITIKEHPIRFGSGTFTVTTGTMLGTFTKPMVIADGRSIQPTGKKFALGMVTIGHWTANRRMDHEWLYFDNQDFMKQLGISK